MEFFKCRMCGNIIAYVKDSGAPIKCCDQDIEKIVPGTVVAAQEKHIPVVKRSGEKVFVKVGDVAHPMKYDHYIEWIALETTSGNQRKLLKPGEEPQVCFHIFDADKVVKAYSYCNLHSLWSS
ncbi:MAG: desulfoferrodoxin [Eggerthellaceae bacterium]|nr:desulfoferrodoxin [Eggerthellaceae bacterium]